MPKPLAKGSTKPGRAGLEFGVVFSEDDAKEIKTFATEHNVSFGEAVRTLVEWGLDSFYNPEGGE